MTMTTITVWHGTDQALRQLHNAVNRNCTCRDEATTCPAHKMLLDQSVLDHLAFVASRRAAYLHGEFDPQGEWF